MLSTNRFRPIPAANAMVAFKIQLTTRMELYMSQQDQITQGSRLSRQRRQGRTVRCRSHPRRRATRQTELAVPCMVRRRWNFPIVVLGFSAAWFGLSLWSAITAVVAVRPLALLMGNPSPGWACISVSPTDASTRADGICRQPCCRLPTSTCSPASAGQPDRHPRR